MCGWEEWERRGAVLYRRGVSVKRRNERGGSERGVLHDNVNMILALCVCVCV